MAKRSASSPASPRKRATSKKTTQEAADPAAAAAAPTAPLAPSDEEIRLRAYHRYLERGATDGADFDDWVEAEKDLKTARHN